MAGRPLVLGHRGASRAAPENTLVAFATAREQGADGVELDVRRTADGVLVVHHDPQIAAFGLIATSSFAATRAAHPSVPTLEEALRACADMLVNVEIKCLPWEPDADHDRSVVHQTIDMVHTLAPAAIVSSFDLGAVDEVRVAAPELTTGWLTSGQNVLDAARLASECGHAWLNPDRMQALHASPEVVAAVHDLGVRVNVWTVDDPDECRHLAAAGVDAIITNTPDTVLAACRRDPVDTERAVARAPAARA